MNHKYKNNYERLMAIGHSFNDSMQQVINGFDKDGYMYHAALVLVKAPEDPPEGGDDTKLNAEYIGTMSDGAAGIIFESLGQEMLKQEEEAKGHG